MGDGVSKRGYKENLLVLVFGALFLFSIVMILNQGFRATGYATEVTTTSNVTITTYFAIALSQNLTNGIEFGNIATLPATNQNASHNYDGVNTTAGGASTSPGTSMWTNVSTDSNSGVDFCIKADALNTSTGAAIGLGNETYANSSVTNMTRPDLVDETGLTTSYVKSGVNTAAGNSSYYRFWLDVPAATATGVYNNTVSFKGVATGGVC